MVLVPENVTVVAVVELIPAAGVHTYVVAPEVVSVVVVPRQIATDDGVAVTVGNGVTLIVCVAEDEQPVVVPVTV